MKKKSEKEINTGIDTEIQDAPDPIAVKKAKKLEKKKANGARKLNRFFDRIFGFALATVIMVGVGALGAEYILVKGPSENAEKIFIRTALETRRFDFVANLFLNEEELAEIDQADTQDFAGQDVVFDDSLVTVSETKTDENGMDAYGLVDDDGDGIIFLSDTYRGSTYYMMVVLDPTRVFLGMPDQFGGAGLTLDAFCEKYGAIGGINAGGFIDADGAGTGGLPDGITIVDGVCYNDAQISGCVGLTEDGILYVGYYSYEDCVKFGLKYACSFSPIIIMNGEKVDESTLESGINPRTAIGQRGDGAIVLMVVDGRQAYSIGVSFSDCADIMLKYGVVNAINMDGGSSSCMYYNGELVNHPTNQAGGTRYLPDAWLVK